MAILSVGVSVEEEASIRHHMKMAGETNLSAHLRRVYFGKGQDDAGLIKEMRQQIERLTETLTESHNMLRTMAAMRSDGLELKLLAGLYSLLYPSVDTGVQALADRYINFDGVQTILEGQRK